MTRWLAVVVAVALSSACSSLDPERPVYTAPGEPSSEEAANVFLHAAAGGNLDMLRHIIPDADACSQLADFPECPELQPALDHRVWHIQLAVAPYTGAHLEKSPNPGPLQASELWLAHIPGKPTLVIITLKVLDRWFALAKVGGV